MKHYALKIAFAALVMAVITPTFECPAATLIPSEMLVNIGCDDTTSNLAHPYAGSFDPDSTYDTIFMRDPFMMMPISSFDGLVDVALEYYGPVCATNDGSNAYIDAHYMSVGYECKGEYLEIYGIIGVFDTMYDTLPFYHFGLSDRSHGMFYNEYNKVGICQDSLPSTNNVRDSINATYYDKCGYFTYDIDPERGISHTGYRAELYFDKPVVVTDSFFVFHQFSFSGIDAPAHFAPVGRIRDTLCQQHFRIYVVKFTGEGFNYETFWDFFYHNSYDARHRARLCTFYPIVSLPCPKPKGLHLLDRENDQATVKWRPYLDGHYQLGVFDAAYPDSVVALYSVGDDDTLFTISGVDNTRHLRVKLRRSCYFARYDSIVWSPWSEAVELPATAVGIEEAVQVPFGLYPNPTHSCVTISLQQPAERATVSIVDAAGREVLSSRVQDGAMQLTVDTRGLPAGAYIVKLLSPTAAGVRRLLVE